MAYVSGAYTATFNSTTIGSTEDGFEVIETFHDEDIKTDEFGDVVVAKIDRGVTTRVRLNFVEYDSIKAAIYSGRTQGDPKAGVGKLLAGAALVLTPTADTTAADDASTWTFHAAIPEGDVTILLSSRHRKGPLTFLCYPTVASSNKTYTVAAAS